MDLGKVKLFLDEDNIFLVILKEKNIKLVPMELLLIYPEFLHDLEEIDHDEVHHFTLESFQEHLEISNFDEDIKNLEYLDQYGNVWYYSLTTYEQLYDFVEQNKYNKY